MKNPLVLREPFLTICAYLGILMAIVWTLGLIDKSTNCPDPMGLNAIEWQRIATLNTSGQTVVHFQREIDSLKQHIEWLWNTREAVRNDLCIHAGHDMDDPCAGMVSIEAVEQAATFHDTWEGVTILSFDDSTWQRLTEGSR